jgi:hypothetical protein
VKKPSTWVFAGLSVAALVIVALMHPRYELDPDFAKKEYIPGLKNFARLTPRVWRGHAPGEEGLKVLKGMGVKTIIDFRTRGEPEELPGDPQVNYIRLPFSATEPPPQEAVDRFLSIVTDPDRQPVFFHCRFGKDRTGTFAALYRIRIQGWEPEKAVQEMKHFGFRSIYRDLINFVRSQRPAKRGAEDN